jgi:HEAT repeat protein
MMKRILALVVGCLLFAVGAAMNAGQPDDRKLLRHPNPQVRLEAALALVERQDEEAIGVLIDLLAELRPAQRRLAEQALRQLAEEWSPNPTLTKDDEVSRRIRRDSWAAWWRNTDGPALLTAFRKRTLSPEQTDKVLALIAQLGDKVFAKRERASAELVNLGPAVVPMLRQALQGADLEQIQRLHKCLKQIAKNLDEDALPHAAARLLAVRKPAGATQALLAFLPFTDDEVMKWEVGKALRSLAVQNGKPDPILMKTLKDASPLRRAVAAEVLAGLDHGDYQNAVRQLLTDPDGTVRLRVAVALVCARDKEAVPVLIDLVADLPREQLWQAEEILFRLAGVKTPQAEPGDDAAARKKYRDAWKMWWKDNGPTAKLAALEIPPPLLGFTVIAEVADGNRANSRVVEVDQGGKVRWQIDGLNQPVDVRVLPGNRVLIAEHAGARITERDVMGTIRWQVANLPGQPYNVQRLPGGNTFAATSAGLMEFDPTGKTVFKLNVLDLTAACKTPSGQMACITTSGKCIRLDAAGNEIKRFDSGQDGTHGCGIDQTARGSFLISLTNRNVVEEFDPEGKSLRQAQAPGITTATAVRNGHVVVANYYNGNVVELDRAGKVVWQYNTPPGYNPFLARQR